MWVNQLGQITVLLITILSATHVCAGAVSFTFACPLTRGVINKFNKIDRPRQKNEHALKLSH